MNFRIIKSIAYDTRLPRTGGTCRHEWALGTRPNGEVTERLYVEYLSGALKIRQATDKCSREFFIPWHTIVTAVVVEFVNDSEESCDKD